MTSSTIGASRCAGVGFENLFICLALIKLILFSLKTLVVFNEKLSQLPKNAWCWKWPNITDCSHRNRWWQRFFATHKSSADPRLYVVQSHIIIRTPRKAPFMEAMTECVSQSVIDVLCGMPAIVLLVCFSVETNLVTYVMMPQIFISRKAKSWNNTNWYEQIVFFSAQWYFNTTLLPSFYYSPRDNDSLEVLVNYKVPNQYCCKMEFGPCCLFSVVEEAARRIIGLGSLVYHRNLKPQ